jgi:hypothetical protein
MNTRHAAVWIDHHTDNQLVAHARHYLRAADKVRG